MESRIFLELLVLGVGTEIQKELGFRPADEQEVDLQQRPKRGVLETQDSLEEGTPDQMFLLISLDPIKEDQSIAHVITFPCSQTWKTWKTCCQNLMVVNYLLEL